MRTAALIAAASVMILGLAPFGAERAAAPASADCRLVPGKPEGGPLYLIHSCIADRDLLELARVAMQAPGGAARMEAAQLANLSTILGQPPAVIEQFLLIAGQQDVGAEKLADKLVEMSGAHKVLIGEWLADPVAAQPELATLIKDARRAAESGRYEDAHALLTKASVVAETAALGTPAVSAESLGLAAAARAGLGQIALIRSQYPEAAIYFEAALRLVADGNAERRNAYGSARAQALYRQGRDGDDTGALMQAIEAYRGLLNAGAADGAAAASAQLRRNLGHALLRLGTRTGALEPLQEALIVFRQTLEDFPRTRQPLDWARAQQDLGATLFRLGLAENSTTRLEEAVTAFLESLKEYTRASAPLEWAAVQSGLGTALWSLGSRGTGHDRFEAAVAAYREGLKQISREHMPLDWAARQNNLGVALVSLAERKTSRRSLQDAVTAFRNSLETYQDESATYYIGGVKANLDGAERLLKQFRAKGKMPASQ